MYVCTKEKHSHYSLGFLSELLIVIVCIRVLAEGFWKLFVEAAEAVRGFRVSV